MTQPMARSAVRIARVRAVRVGLPARHVWGGQVIISGAGKAPVRGPVAATTTGLVGDGQADTVHHGGPDKAVLAYAGRHYAHWRAEGLDLPEGAFFENLTLTGTGAPGDAGPDEISVRLGETWRVGTAVLQVSQPRRPCFKLAKRWQVRDLAVRVQETGRSGWYLRVLAPGLIAPGDAVELLDRNRAAPSVGELARVMNDKRDLNGARTTLAAPGLPEHWRDQLRRRLDGESADDSARLHG